MSINSLQRRIEKLLAAKHLDTAQDEERWQTMNAGGREMLLQKLSQGGQVEYSITEEEALGMDDFKAMLAERAAATKADWLAHRYKQAVFFLPQVKQLDERYKA